MTWKLRQIKKRVPILLPRRSRCAKFAFFCRLNLARLSSLSFFPQNFDERDFRKQIYIFRVSFFLLLFFSRSFRMISTRGQRAGPRLSHRAADRSGILEGNSKLFNENEWRGRGSREPREILRPLICRRG